VGGWGKGVVFLISDTIVYPTGYNFKVGKCPKIHHGVYAKYTKRTKNTAGKIPAALSLV